MEPTLIDAARAAIMQFAADDDLIDVAPFNRGHIHDTFVSTWRAPSAEYKLLHQHLNHHVFTNIPGLMHNIECVTQHLREKIGDGSLHGFHTLRLVKTREDGSYLLDGDGFWRTYEFVANTTSYDLCDSAERAFDAARAFGWFQAQLIDIDVAELCETIPDFFSSPYRLQQFDTALSEDLARRAHGAADEIAFVAQRRRMVDVIENDLAAGAFPRRVVHGDTKLNNVLFDLTTGKPVCVVDLDTCMPSYSLYDFGDLVRFTAATSSEDEVDTTRAGMDIELYRALVSGILDSARSFLTRREIELMPFAARLVTFTIGLRFLTDHLAGDDYFKISREGHNLDRARVQFKMVESMERQEREMAAAARHQT